MKIYIASSWRNQHGVEMLTALLREKGHTVTSWVENNYGENHNHVTKRFSFDEWMQTDESEQAFDFDTDGATTCDLLIYYSPGGMDACAEMGAAWGKGIPILGLHAKGENLGLMRKMPFKWVDRYSDLLEEVESFNESDILNVDQ